MIRQKTLFVIGAGASHELNFPLGSDLLGMLADLFNVQRNIFGDWLGSQEFVNLAKAYEHSTKTDHNLVLEKARFIRSKILGTVKSIDQLVHTYSADDLFVNVAKLGITKAIANAEAKNLPKIKTNLPLCEQLWQGNNWLDVFCRHYFSGFEAKKIDGLFDDVSFVCLNYDRCLEYGLMRAAAYHFNLSDQEAFAIMDRINVVHPYGSLGRLPQSLSGLASTFDDGQRDASVIMMSHNIRTFTEGTADESIKNSIARAVEASNLIVCLGFGYHSMNVGLLQNPDVGQRKRVFGTTLGMSEPNAEAAQYQIFRQLNHSNPTPGEQKFEALNASNFLNKYELAIFK